MNEGRNAEAIAENFRGRDNIMVPRIVWKHTTRRVLVMELIDGIKITDAEAMRAAAIDVQAVAQLLTETYCQQIFLHGLFHADPHPGNLFVSAGPKLIMLDFGLCRRLDDAARTGYAHLVRALLTGDSQEMVQAFRALGFKTRTSDPRTLVALGEAFVESAAPGRAYADPELVAQVNTRLARVFRANPVTDMPREFLLLMRVMGLLSGLGKHLDSRVDILNTLLPYTKAALEVSAAQRTE